MALNILTTQEHPNLSLDELKAHRNLVMRTFANKLHTTKDRSELTWGGQWSENLKALRKASLVRLKELDYIAYATYGVHIMKFNKSDEDLLSELGMLGEAVD